MNRISRKSLSRRKRRSLGRRSKVSRRSQRRRSRVSRRRSRCNSRRLKRSCKRGKRCSWVKRKSSGRRKHKGYCKKGGSNGNEQNMAQWSHWFDLDKEGVYTLKAGVTSAQVRNVIINIEPAELGELDLEQHFKMRFISKENWGDFENTNAYNVFKVPDAQQIEFDDKYGKRPEWDILYAVMSEKEYMLNTVKYWYPWWRCPNDKGENIGPLAQIDGKNDLKEAPIIVDLYENYFDEIIYPALHKYPNIFYIGVDDGEGHIWREYFKIDNATDFDKIYQKKSSQPPQDWAKKILRDKQ